MQKNSTDSAPGHWADKLIAVSTKSRLMKLYLNQEQSEEQQNAN